VISPDTVTILGTIQNPVSYTFQVTDDFGCSYDTTITLEVLPNPLLFQADSACTNLEVEVGADGSWEGGVWSVVYVENDTAVVSISDTLAIDPMISSSGPGLVKLIFDDEYCRTQDTLNLEFYPLPKVNVIGENIVCWGDTLWLNAQVSGPIDTYLWNTDDYDPDVTNPTSYIVGDETNYYGVTVSGFCGQAADDLLIYSRACFVETPNIITPNGDGKNDRFYIRYVEYFPGSKFVVYNRWGKKVYEVDSYDNATGWDGRNQDGVELADGVYFYTLILNDAYKRFDTQDKYVKGSVTVTRERVR
jgi:gliding motility-associated-like protein